MVLVDFTWRQSKMYLLIQKEIFKLLNPKI